MYFFAYASLEFLERSGAERSRNNQGNTQTKNLTSIKENQENEHSLKQKIHQPNEKQKNGKKLKEETLYKKIATPDRPPPAAAMLP